MFDPTEVLGLWSTDPCEGETEDTCRMQGVRVDGEERCVLVSLPSSGLVEDPALVIVFHGSDGNGAQQRQTMNGELEGLALEEAVSGEALVVYPDGRTHSDCDGNTCWDRSVDGPDLRFFDEMVEHFVREWGVDARRVFVVGHSRGGRLVEVLACNRSQTLAGGAMMAVGSGNVSSCDASMPMWIAHGTDDQTIPFSKGVEHAENWAERNFCVSPELDTFPVDSCTPLDGCSTPVEFCPATVDEWGGHAPPAIADTELWRFFSDLSVLSGA
jgi:poly(3-hydroxybutyrate) depolymerase